MIGYGTTFIGSSDNSLLCTLHHMHIPDRLIMIDWRLKKITFQNNLNTKNNLRYILCSNLITIENNPYIYI